SATIALMTAGALAQSETPTPMQDPSGSSVFMQDPAFEPRESEGGFYSAYEGQMLAGNLIGQQVYAGATPDAEVIGDVNDIVLSPDGRAEAVVIGVGGFLGMGEKEVALDFARLNWSEREDGIWL